jgi:hypothetical protein
MDRLAAPAQDLPGGHERWVMDSMHWLLEEFGREPLQRPTVLPPALLGSRFDSTQAATRSLFATMCRRMDVPLDQVELRFGPPSQPTSIATSNAHSTAVPMSTCTVPVGRWTRENARSVVIVSPRLLSDPVVLVAVLAHELGHELLVGSGRVKASRADHESLTDLLTVFYGFGIVAAYASLALPRHPSGRGRAALARGYPARGGARPCAGVLLRSSRRARHAGMEEVPRFHCAYAHRGTGPPTPQGPNDGLSLKYPANSARPVRCRAQRDASQVTPRCAPGRGPPAD